MEFVKKYFYKKCIEELWHRGILLQRRGPTPSKCIDIKLFSAKILSGVTKRGGQMGENAL